MKEKENKYPELDKIKAVSEKSQEIGSFLDWLESIGYHIAEYKKLDESDKELYLEEIENSKEQLLTIYLPREQILAKYFKIDLDKAEKERKLILDSLKN